MRMKRQDMVEQICSRGKERMHIVRGKEKERKRKKVSMDW